jgi:hypothetical protein
MKIHVVINRLNISLGVLRSKEDELGGACGAHGGGEGCIQHFGWET